MSRLSCGIVGLPNVGKSTLFNALTAHEAAASNYPFCTIDPNVGVVEVPDGRLEVLSKLSGSAKVIPAVMEFVDIAGLVKGASQGEGLGNKFLTNIRETDAIVHVVRCFDSGDVVHVDGKVDPIADVEVIELELQLADVQMAENALSKVGKQARTGQKEAVAQAAALEKAVAHLNNGKPLRTLELSEEELVALKPYPFLTGKKVLYLANVGDEDLPTMENAYVEKLRAYAEAEGNVVVPICAKIEAELIELTPEERLEFLSDLGLEEAGLNRVIRQAFSLLDLLVFLTTGEQETRAWTIRRGMTAPQAAGRIHGDIEKGFIRAEVIPFQEMVDLGGRVAAKEAGKMRSEGKEYIVKDGDVVLFLHN